MFTPVLELPEVAFFGRSFSEYLLFLGLRSEDLAGRRILDCAAGPSAFTAEAVARGHDVTAIDPSYNRTETALRRAAESSFARMFTFIRAHPDLFPGRTFPNVEAAAGDRKRATEQFLSDYYVGVALGRYRCGALPALPCGDRSFDLAICAHLLFVYDHLFDLDFHVAAARELCRVAREEVRIHPLVNRAGQESAFVAPLRAALDAVGIRSEIIPVDFQFFRCTDRTLILRPRK